MTDDNSFLEEEVKHFIQEKERIRNIVGQIGGRRKKNRETLMTAIFAVLVASLFVVDILRDLLHLPLGGLPTLVSLEIAILLVSLKIIWMIHVQSRVAHFQFWILNSIEFQINRVSKRLNDMEKRVQENKL